MSTFSEEFEKGLLERFDQYLTKRFELEKAHADEWDLVPKSRVMELLGVSATTLDNWENAGLKRYQSPFENSKKIYYRKTDILNFMAVD